MRRRQTQGRNRPLPGQNHGRPPRRRRRGKRTLHYLLLLNFILGAGITLLMTVLLQIEEIVVTGGADRYHPEEIIEVSGVEVGTNLLRLRTGDIEQELRSAFPYIESVRVRRRLPHTVELALTQYQPQAALVYHDGLAFITLEGKLLERGARDLPPGMPLVRGVSLEDHQPGEILGGQEHPGNEERLIMLRYLLEAAERVDFPPITDVDLRDRLNIRVIHEDRLLLELGSEADLEYKLTFLNHIIQNEVSPTAQASLDASGVRHRQIVERGGQMINGEFFPDEILTPHALAEQEPMDEEEYDEEEYDEE